MIRKAMVATLLFGVALVALPAIAGAHVEIAPDGKLSADGTINATLTVPNECVGGATKTLDLNFPTTPALDTADVTPVTGWTVVSAKNAAGTAITKLTFTGSLTGTENQVFNIKFGTLAAGTDTAKFTALQNCADGSVIRWVEPTPPGGAEPEFPAPVLEVKPATTDSTPAPTKVAVTTTKSSDDSNTGVYVGIGIAVVAVALIVVGVVLYKRNK